jgi:CxxC motif-containing protein (DUF1111 family)
MLHRFGVRDQYAAWRIMQFAGASRRNFIENQFRAVRRRPSDRALEHVGWDGVKPANPLRESNLLAAGEPQLRLDRIPAPSLGPAPRSFIIACGCGGYLGEPDPWLWEVNTPPLFGLGLLEQITLADVQAIAAAQPERVRGRAYVRPDGRLGRFGWKAQHASLRDFNDEACATELGIGTPTTRQAESPKLHPTDDDESASPYWRSVRANPDISAAGVDALTAFVASLPRPREASDPHAPAAAHGNPSESSVEIGRRWFDAIGCAACHTPDVGTVRGVYSDLLLHDIGTQRVVDYRNRGRESLSSPMQANLAAVGPTTLYSAATATWTLPKPGEFRTPPLWGVADSGPYLHDGRAETLEQAIAAHGVQAEVSLKTYQIMLNSQQRQHLVTFLQSLRAP